MIDQATELRQLLSSRDPRVHATPSSVAYCALVCGGKGGVGSTSTAINLAMAFGSLHSRVLLIEAGTCRNDMSTLCHLAGNLPCKSSAAVSTHRLSVFHETNSGIDVVPASWQPPGEAAESTPAQTYHLLRQVEQWKSEYDVLVIDAGNRNHDIASRLSSQANDMILVTTCDQVAVMDSYAMLKIQAGQSTLPSTHALMNRAPTSDAGREAYQRIALACQRFLGLEVRYLASVPQATVYEHQEIYPIGSEWPHAQEFISIASQLYPGVTHHVPAPTNPIAFKDTILA